MIMKKDNIKWLIKVMLINVIILIGVMSLTTYFSYRLYVRNVNNVILGLIDVSEEEAIQILNSDKPNYQKADLSKYGISEDNAVINSMQHSFYMSVLMNAIFTILIELVITYMMYVHLSKYNKKVANLTEYVKDINNGRYELKIKDNVEGELSRLQNELYKITIMLKEENVAMSKQKENLKKAISDISHQIKTPLTSINIILDNLNDEKMDLKTRKRFINELQKQINLIDNLVITLLKLARFDTNSVKFYKEEINVKKIIKECVDNLSTLAELKNINILLTSKTKAVFKGDYKWELEALTNIIKNGIEHSDNDKTIQIFWEENALYTRIIIKDEGYGIDSEDLSHIFERFYKAKTASSSSFGIGLSLAKAIINEDGGVIKVTSNIGEGTSFEIKYLK